MQTMRWHFSIGGGPQLELGVVELLAMSVDGIPSGKTHNDCGRLH